MLTHAYDIVILTEEDENNDVEAWEVFKNEGIDIERE